MPFKTDLKSDFITGADEIILEIDLVYYDNRSRETFVIAPGFVCNGASIPRFLWSVLGHPFQYVARRPAILHDWLYRNKVVKRKVADQMFYDALIEEGMEADKAQLFYAGVRIGGSDAYKKGKRACDTFIPC